MGGGEVMVLVSIVKELPVKNDFPSLDFLLRTPATLSRFVVSKRREGSGALNKGIPYHPLHYPGAHGV
jgi:hypothetical protein